ncbi:ABC transporter permease [Aquibacillus koreensis]|uniref:ABC transporter permease n=1 Tax=Aquibacillus koreensis TaxID=279446 RepID=A0A9X3WJX8_9BACI|nr:ABC transporter permease [Aquibacillus koreensis]MCT2535727.1 ABC transporter permease [Aquibacillus koreensis]MDC3419988.1 ABC transporter permease [Aquibacillus koreensis]
MRLLNLLNANIRKHFIEMKRYLPNTMAFIITFYIIFLAMFAGIKLIGDPSSQDANIQYVIVNYIFWYLAMVVVNDIGWQISNEASQGTFEQLSMSPMGIWRIMTARLISSTIVNFLIIVALLYISMATTGQWLNIDVITLLPILVLTLISMFGLGLIIAGMTVVFKQIQAFLQILQFILAALVFVQSNVLPFLVFFPIVKGVELVRNVMIDGVSLSQIAVGDFLILGFNAIFYFIVGLGIFIYCERFAMRKGLLAHY